MEMTMVGTWAGGGPGPWFLVFPLGWIGLIVGAILLFRGRSDRWRPHSAEEILAERYAKGEVSAEEYRERLNVLQHKGG